MPRDPIFDIFREEAREHLTALEKLFLDLEDAGTQEARRDLIDNLFRHAHSLKGDAKVVGLLDLKDAAQELEDILDRFRSDPGQVDRAAVDQGLAQFDRVRAALETWQSGDTAPSDDDALPAEASPTEASPPEELPAEARPAEALSERPAAAPGSENAASPATETEPSPQNAVTAGIAEESFTVRVPSDRLDRMLNLAGEVRISQSGGGEIEARLAELIEQFSTLPRPEQTDAASAAAWQAVTAAWQTSLLDQFRRLETDVRRRSLREQQLMEGLEGDIRQARLLPLAMLADILRRAVRDLSQLLEKPIRYEVDVGKIMLDKAVIEALKDPLLHLLRNAADHGIESPAERRSKGKPETATIRIDARGRGGRVRIRVADDGRGVDYAEIRRRLVARGSLGAAEAARLTEQELALYLFRAGFTTAAAGDISGRGVGLDVVRDAVQKLQGTAELESSSDAGATFAITVPVTISTVRIVTVLAGGQYYGIPGSSLLRIGHVPPSDLRELRGEPVLPLEGRPVRWVQLADLLGTTAARSPASESRPYVVVAAARGPLAVAVDELEEEAEVLLKPPPFPLAGLPGITGATIRPDGSVQLVLDLSGTAPVRTPARPAVESRPAGRILVVDDSPTTRAVLRNVLTAAGYVVRTAVDGLDALEKLRTRPVDLIVCDVEMPRLNGLDFTRQAKSKYQLPVILVTGKEKEEHRREGLRAGADAYVVKSTFAGEGLLDVIKQLI